MKAGVEHADSYASFPYRLGQLLVGDHLVLVASFW